MGTTLYGSFTMLLSAVNCTFPYGGIISDPVSDQFITKGKLELVVKFAQISTMKGIINVQKHFPLINNVSEIVT